MRIRKCELSEIVGELPEVEPWMAEDADQGADLFICALGFEPRSLALPARFAQSGGRFAVAMKLKFSTNRSENATNEPDLDRYLTQIASSVYEMEVDRPDFTRELRQYLAKHEEQFGRLSVLMDISVFANRLILRCMKAVLESRLNLTIAYAEAEEYYPTQAEYEACPSEWRLESMLGLERGVREVMTSVDHPGCSLDPIPDRVVLFPTFKPERSMAVVSAVDPAILLAPAKKIIWVVGTPHLEENRWRVSAVRSINGITDDSVTYEVSTFKYKETLQVLETIHARYSDEAKLTISPLGSKLQALAISLFCYLRPDVRVMFAIPKEYNATHFSSGVGAIWKIRFRDVRQLTGLLDRVGSLRVIQ